MKRFAIAGFALAALAAAIPARAAEPALLNGWMRPAAAGTPSIDAYVDIRSDVALKLVAASTPAAKRVDLVAGTFSDKGYETKVVTTFDVPAKGELRFALRGNVLRFVEVQKSFGNSDPVPLRLEFRDADGKTLVATTTLEVRGLLAPRPVQSGPPPLEPTSPAPMK